MSKINMIHHINIQITDRQQTREWYEKVLGAEFLDRGPALNKRQLQFRVGTAEIHTSESQDFIDVPRVHFAMEVENWDEMLAHLDSVGVAYSRTGSGSFTGTGGEDPYQGKREDTGENYTYIHDPDGNLIELVYHTLGLEDSKGDAVGLVRDAKNVRWTQIDGFVESEYAGEKILSS
ncbi:MAG: VOC family protein [Chloroflexi bacterium]|nr:VOC family protein [Chloroflexota bacterium]